MMMSWGTFRSQYWRLARTSVFVNYLFFSVFGFRNGVSNFIHCRQLSAGKLFIEISWTDKAIHASPAMLNNYIHLMYLFKLHTIQHVFLIYKSQRRFKLHKSYYTWSKREWSQRTSCFKCCINVLEPLEPLLTLRRVEMYPIKWLCAHCTTGRIGGAEPWLQSQAPHRWWPTESYNTFTD